MRAGLHSNTYSLNRCEPRESIKFRATYSWNHWLLLFFSFASSVNSCSPPNKGSSWCDTFDYPVHENHNKSDSHGRLCTGLKSGIPLKSLDMLEFIHKQILRNQIIFKLIHEKMLEFGFACILCLLLLLWVPSFLSVGSDEIYFERMRCHKSSKNVNNSNTNINNKNKMEISLRYLTRKCVHGDV